MHQSEYPVLHIPSGSSSTVNVSIIDKYVRISKEIRDSRDGYVIYTLGFLRQISRLMKLTSLKLSHATPLLSSPHPIHSTA